VRARAVHLATGIAAAALVFVAVPAVLLTLTGVPDPGHLVHTDLTVPGTVLDVLAAVAWIAWVGCAAPLVASVVRRVRRRDATAPPGARFPELVASRIAAVVLAVSPVAAATATGVAGSGAAAPPAPAAATAAPAPAPTTTPTTTTGAGVAGTYTVVDGDTLWSIAERFYDDGSEWSTIAQANLGQVMADGTRFLDPSLIRPGWVLAIPQPAATTASPPVTVAPEGAPGAPASEGAPAAVAPEAPPTVAPTGPTTPAPEAALQSTSDTDGHPSPDPGTAVSPDHSPPPHRSPRPRRSLRVHHSPAPHGRAPDQPAGQGLPLPELVAIGTGAVVAAALARRARRARHRAAMVRPEGGRWPDPSEPAAAAAADLVPFEDVPALAWVEAANRHLAAALASVGRTSEVPPVRLVRVGPDGVEVRLARSVEWAPPGWSTVDGPAWLLPAAAELETVVRVGRGSEPWLPALLPVGTNHDGTWLVPVEPGGCVPVIGATADAVVAAMRLAVESWAWADQLAVTDDAGVAGTAATTVGRWGDGFVRPRVVYFGDPADLTPAAATRCSVVTTLPVPATDLTVTVDANAASLHPLGVVVQPDLLDDSRREALAEALAVTATATPTAATVTPATVTVTGSTVSRSTVSRAHSVAGGPVTRPVDAPGRPEVASAGPTDPVGTAEPAARFVRSELAPGPVEVRLLTAVPRLDGLAEELTPKRARRAVELVAYLALHHPAPVTGDRLRTRVLGSADADAAAKTLFNTAGTARRAMGRDTSGEQLLPLATKGSHYRISPLVTADVTRATALVEAAGDATTRDEAMALLREALGLVEDEPLARTLSGYGWWQAEGHEQQVAGVMVDAACRLAVLATADGLFDLARWGVEQARRVEPYSEALSRAAMQVAANAGDADRLRREWQECLRRVDELDPGSLPSEATENLYADLCRRVPSMAGADTGPQRTADGTG